MKLDLELDFKLGFNWDSDLHSDLDLNLDLVSHLAQMLVVVCIHCVHEPEHTCTLLFSGSSLELVALQPTHPHT